MQEMDKSPDHAFELATDRRSKKRTAQDELQCSLGRVTDISSTGMRVTCRRVPKEKWVKFLLHTKADPLLVQAEVVWTKRMGFRKHEVGLHFINPSLELVNLIRCCSLSGTVWQWCSPR